MNERRDWLKAASCASLLALGFGLVWGFAAKLSYDIFVGSAPWVWSSVSLSHDYEPYIATQEQDPVTKMPELRHVRLNGDKVDSHIQRSNRSTATVPMSASRHKSALIPGFNPWEQKSLAVMRQKPGSHEFEMWRVIGGEGRSAYLVGHDLRTKQPIGYIGKNGLQAHRPAVSECLELCDEVARIVDRGIDVTASDGAYIDGRTKFIGDFAKAFVYAVGANGELLKVDLDERRVTSEKFASPVRSLHRLETWTHWSVDDYEIDPDGVHEVETQLLVRTQEQLKLLSLGKWYDMAIPVELREQDFSVIFSDANNAIAFTERELPEVSRSRYGSPIKHHAVDIYWFDATGKVSRHESAKLERRHLAPSVAHLLFVMPSSVPHLFHWLIRDELQSTAEIGWMVLCSMIVGLVGAIACLRREARFESSPTHRWLWAAFIFLAGLPGWIGYRFHRRWPLLVECENCHSPRPQDRAECPSCQQAEGTRSQPELNKLLFG